MKRWGQAHAGRQKADGRLPGAGKEGMGVGGRLFTGTGFVSRGTKMSQNYLW